MTQEVKFGIGPIVRTYLATHGITIEEFTEKSVLIVFAGKPGGGEARRVRILTEDWLPLAAAMTQMCGEDDPAKRIESDLKYLFGGDANAAMSFMRAKHSSLGCTPDEAIARGKGPAVAELLDRMVDLKRLQS